MPWLQGTPGYQQQLFFTIQYLKRDAGLILGLRPANERRRYYVTQSLIGWVQT